MLNLTVASLAEIVGGQPPSDEQSRSMAIEAITIDSRHSPQDAVFFALTGWRHNGHVFVEAALAAGAVAAIVEADRIRSFPPEVAKRLIAVDDTRQALQRLAAWWRTQLTATVIAVTGSNGKTIMKDALVRLLSAKGTTAGSPGSFNSQVGVPLSLLSIPREAEFAVIEAGISQPGEMAHLQRMIRPQFGILTNIGVAHLSAFRDRAQLAEEKFLLFRGIGEDGWLMTPGSDPWVEPEVARLPCHVLRANESSDLPRLTAMTATPDGLRMTVQFPGGETIEPVVATPSSEIVSTLHIALSAAYLLGVSPSDIQQALAGYAPGTTRMEIWRSPGGVTLINDSASSDPISVRAAIRALSEWNRGGEGRRVFVFHGMRELGAATGEQAANVGRVAAEAGVDLLLLVEHPGSEATAGEFERATASGEVIRCRSIDDARDRLLPRLSWGDTVLVKGPRGLGISQLATSLIEAMAPNRFIIDLEKIRENIRRFQRLVSPKTRILAMVKALAYGTDSPRIAVDLQNAGLVSYFGVATADEGIALRAAGVSLPILVTMCTPDETAKTVHYRLTPVVYSQEIAALLATAAEAAGKIVDVHIEVDTGMGRLGELPQRVVDLARHIVGSRSLRLVGLMTHFASADDPEQDEFTRSQIATFEGAIEALRGIGISDLLCHANATSGTARFANAQHEMVRLGLGMFGLYPSPAVEERVRLELAVSLLSRIAEIRVLPKGHRIGYSGTFTVPHDDFRVGVVPIGYHDGVPWRLSGRGSVLIDGRPAAILGRISMDSMIIDLQGIPEAARGMDVLIYGRYGGHELRPEEVAAKCDTIAYELVARVGPRVQRVFVG
ncbi:MAG: alanine racemase [Thermoanaerobaculia bacterium]